jgi:hypothetical protein
MEVDQRCANLLPACPASAGIVALDGGSIVDQLVAPASPLPLCWRGDESGDSLFADVRALTGSRRQLQRVARTAELPEAPRAFLLAARLRLVHRPRSLGTLW